MAYVQTFLNDTPYPAAMIVYALDGWALFASPGQYGGDNVGGRRWLNEGTAYIWFYSPGAPPFGAPQVVWKMTSSKGTLSAGPEGREPVIELKGVNAIAMTVKTDGTIAIVATQDEDQ